MYEKCYIKIIVIFIGNIHVLIFFPHYIKTEAPGGMTYSEQNMTIFFSVVTGLAFLATFTYAIYRCKRKTQYSHRPLYNSEETGENFKNILFQVCT